VLASMFGIGFHLRFSSAPASSLRKSAMCAAFCSPANAGAAFFGFVSGGNGPYAAAFGDGAMEQALAAGETVNSTTKNHRADFANDGNAIRIAAECREC